VSARHDGLDWVVEFGTVYRPDESKIRPHVVDPVRRKHFVFMGAAVFADLLKDTDQGWVLKSTYDEMGADRLFGDQKY
jgi:actin-related protein